MQQVPAVLCYNFMFLAMHLRMGFFNACMGFVWVS